jgi:hypothetical protein
MGLDMYIFREEDNEAVNSEVCYWRKHPNLHGFIVQTFAAGVDECQRIYLDDAKVETVLRATLEDKLPTTQGFFFGTSQPSDKLDTIKQLGALIEDMRTHPGVKYYYRSSW